VFHLFLPSDVTIELSRNSEPTSPGAISQWILSHTFCAMVLRLRTNLVRIWFSSHMIIFMDKIIEQHGVCRAISYIAQTLSAEPTFGAKLTKPVKVQLPSRWNSVGTAADFFINVRSAQKHRNCTLTVLKAAYAISLTSSGTLTPQYPAIIIFLANMSSNIKHLTVVASSRALHLFNYFSSPHFLLADEGHPRLLFFM
jgi:hypothetical protein